MGNSRPLAAWTEYKVVVTIHNTFLIDADSEDEGFVVAFVYDQEKDKSEFIILDAENFSGTPLARVLLPSRVPFGFHGSWIGLD